MLPRLPSVLAGLVVLALAGAPAAAAAHPAPAAIPPDLQALVARSARLHIADEVSQTSSVLNNGVGFLETRSTSQVRLSPLELETTSGSGTQVAHLRLVGGTVYLEIPGLARLTHGRHWLRATLRQLGLSRAQLLGQRSATGQSSTALSQTSAITKLLREASTIQEIGPSLVDREPVTEFLVTLDFAQLLGGPSPSSAPSGPGSTVDVQLYLAADGLLKRETVDVSELIAITDDVLSDNLPVVVHRPSSHDVVPLSRSLVRALDSAALSAPSTAPSPTAGVGFDITSWIARRAPAPAPPPAGSGPASFGTRLVVDAELFGPLGGIAWP